MEDYEIDYLNKYMKWEAYYAPKFKAIFGFDMPTDTYGIDITKIPDKVKQDILILGKYGIEGNKLLYEIIKNNPKKFSEKETE